jgi:PAS domain S-box-containing protein
MELDVGNPTPVRWQHPTEHLVLEALPAAVVVFRPNGEIEWHNRRAAELWGRAPASGDETPIAEVLRTGHPVRDAELTIERPDGTRLDVLANAAPLPDGGAVACLVDITERTRDATLVAERERELADFFENGAIGLHWVGPDGRILRANRAELEMLGYAAEEYVGRNIAEFHADARVIDDILARLRGDEVLHDYPARLRHKDGSIRYVVIDSSVYRAGEEFRHTRCFTRDVTAQHAAEEALQASEARYRALIESAPDAVFVADLTGRYTDVNPAACTLLGYTRGELLAMRVADLLSDDALPQLAEVRDRLVAGASEGASDVREWMLLRRDGRRVPVEVSTTILPDGRWQAFARDVTERHRLLDAERRARTAAERARAEAEGARVAAEDASRAKSAFLATMSHELRTPLNAIAGYTELLEMGVHGPVTERQREDLARIRRSQQHLLGHINEVLNFARVESGAVRYDLTDVAVAEVVAAAEALVAPQLRERGLAFDAAGVPASCVARADRDKLQQILLNLLSNAVKFTPRGGRVEVSARSDPDSVAVHVRDSGIGIPREKLESVFEPFVQVGRSLSNPAEGTGLGLAISRDLARGMGGDLAAESEVGAGSTFTLTLRHAGEK